MPHLLTLRLFTLLVLIVGTACTAGKRHPALSRSDRAALAATHATLTRKGDRTRHEARGHRFMIATQGTAASTAAESMFALGGNIFDAAAAASFAIAVERPQSTGIGGGGFMLIHHGKTGETMAVDFREAAPRKAFEKMYQDKNGNVVSGLSTEGPLANGVPGIVAGVLAVHEKYGRLDRKQIMQPAIDLAEKGFPVYPHLAEAMEAKKEVLKRYPASRKIFLRKDETPYAVGETLHQLALGKTLRLIAAEGSGEFYRGSIAERITRSQKKWGGMITRTDLSRYEVKYRKPVVGNFKEYTVLSMPPPSSGGIHIIQILNVLQSDSLKALGPLSPEAIHLTASAMQMAFADRATYLGDPDFVDVPQIGLTNPEYARALRDKIPPASARASSSVAAGTPTKYESPETTHFTLMDDEGNVVASTQTINGWFGSGFVVAGTGILMNNEMDDFSAKPGVPNLYGAIGGRANAIVAGKRPLSSMSPTIVLKNGKPVLALGSPSGTRIISCVLLTILNYLEYDMPLYDAVATIRYHHQWLPDEIRVDMPAFPQSVATKLQEMKYAVRAKNLGCRVQAVAREGARLHGVSDPRGEGLSVGR